MKGKVVLISLGFSEIADQEILLSYPRWVITRQKYTALELKENISNLSTWLTRTNSFLKSSFGRVKAAPKQIQTRCCRLGVSRVQMAHNLVCVLPADFTTTDVTLWVSSHSSGKRQVKAEQGSGFRWAAGHSFLHPFVSFAGCFHVVLVSFLSLIQGCT